MASDDEYSAVVYEILDACLGENALVSIISSAEDLPPLPLKRLQSPQGQLEVLLLRADDEDTVRATQNVVALAAAIRESEALYCSIRQAEKSIDEGVVPIAVG